MFWPLKAVPQTMLLASDVPQTMLLAAWVPQTMLLFASDVPQTMLLLARAVPHTMLSTGRTVPQTMFWPVEALATPQVVPRSHALADGMIAPPVSCWLPQMMCLLQMLCIGYGSPGWAVAKNRARRTAPTALRKPAPC